MSLQTIGYLMSDDVDVVELVSVVMPLVASFQIADGLAGSCGGSLRGQGTFLTLRVSRSFSISIQDANTSERYSTLLPTTSSLSRLAFPSLFV